MIIAIIFIFLVAALFLGPKVAVLGVRLLLWTVVLVGVVAAFQTAHHFRDLQATSVSTK